jgi:hypothetical protein
MSSSTRAKRKEKDKSGQSGKRRDDDRSSDNTPRVVPDLEEDFAKLQVDSGQNEPDYAADQGIESSGKGKENLEDWSGWSWDEKNYQWYRTRRMEQGGWEYDTRAPEFGESDNRTDVS